MSTQSLGPGQICTDGSASDSARALAGGPAQRVGEFRFYFADDRWEWSEAVQQMHGYTPGTVAPTTELVLSHKHPDDRNRIAVTIHQVRRTGEPFSTHHRIIDTAGAEHDVVVASQFRDERGVVVGTEGFYVDVTPSAKVLQEEISAEVAKFAQNRSVIEQAKGMLMIIYGINADSAFELLKWRSQETNVKLRLVAEQITRDFVARAQQHHRTPTRAEYDNLLLTAHERINDDPPIDTP